MKLAGAAALAAALMLSACAGTAVLSPAPARVLDGWEPWAVETRTIGLGIPGGARLKPGVRFAGGLQILAAPGDRLHGLSDLKIRGDELVAVTDAGDLVRARLILNERGRPAGLADVHLRPLTGPAGGPFASKGEGDSESLTLTGDGRLIIGFEQTPRLWSYGPLDRLDIRPSPLPVPPVAEGNEGLEALALAPGGWRVAAESGGVWDCDRRACTEVRSPPRIPVPVEDWRITGMDRDPAGAGWFVVQRLYREPIDMRARVRRMAADGALEPVLVELSLPSTVDNFEGIAAVSHGDGVRLYIVSDDNGDARQRTLLLAFDVRPAR